MPYKNIPVVSTTKMVQDIYRKRKAENSLSYGLKKKPKIRRQIFNEQVSIEWIKLPNSVSDDKGAKFYKYAKVGDLFINQGDSIMIPGENKGDPPQIAYVSYMFEENMEKICHAHFYCRCTDTVLGKKSDPREIFLVDHCEDISLSCIQSKANVRQISYDFNWNKLGGIQKAELNDHDNGKHYVFSKRYNYIKSQFVDFVDNKSKCISCFWEKEEEKYNTPTFTEVYLGNSYIQYQDTKYYVGSGIFLESGDYSAKEECNVKKEEEFYTLTKLNGEYVRLSKSDREIFYPEKYRKIENNDEGETMAYPQTIGIIESLKKIKDKVHVKIRIMYRFEDVFKGQLGDPYLLFWTNEFYNIKNWNEWKDLVKGKCFVSNKVYVQNAYEWIKTGPRRFYFEQFYDYKNKKILSELPKEAKNIGLPRNLDFFTKPTEWPELTKRLKSMDLFVGCGGLSDGLERSGLVETKWAIEIDSDAAASFRLNHPSANIVEDDCNKVLNMILKNEHQHLEFPEKGEVDIIVGGPPCQGFSVLNRCAHSKTSKAKNSQIKTFLGFIDYYRPKYMIYENVQNFVSFDCNYHLRSTLKCLLTIGYQVSFGVLQAGNYGLPQARRRFFIVGAAPGLKLPNLPDPTHCFVKKTQWSIKVDNLIYDTGETASGYLGSLPYRHVTVKDAISDLPLVDYDNMKKEVAYVEKADATFYAKSLREYANKEDIVTLHESKPTTDLVKKRIEYIPAYGDWRDLPNINIKLDNNTKTDILPYVYRTKGQPAGTVPRGMCPCVKEDQDCPYKGSRGRLVSLIPWGVAHSANKNRGWRGVYGRLQWDGYFGTVTTEPEPTRTQGKVLHPDQNRVVTVRETARAQGFHDEFQFCGSLSKVYRQIGNAVPPVLAAAIGKEMINSIVSKLKK